MAITFLICPTLNFFKVQVVTKPFTCLDGEYLLVRCGSLDDQIVLALLLPRLLFTHLFNSLIGRYICHPVKIGEEKNMRLGQLARKLALRPAEIVGFLAKNSIQIEDGSNTRIEDDHVSLIMNRFAPDRMAEMTAELAAEKNPTIAEEVAKPEPVNEVKLENVQSLIADIPLDNPEPVIELIKAPKVELSGLKVLGKIELPEPKKKEPQSVEFVATEDNAAPLEEQKKPEPRRPVTPRRERNEQRPLKNPIALQREREAMETEKKRRANAEREKEKRTQNYLKKVKAPTPTKALRIMNDRVEEIVEKKVEAPKTWLGKFMRWMNT